MSIERLVELAKNIEDEKLREKTIELLKDIKLTHSELSKLEREDPEKVLTPFGVNGRYVFRDLLTHTEAVVKACISLAREIENNYGIKIKKDFLIAGALLHDIMKVYEYKDAQPTNILLDHSSLALAELYKRDFPEEILHMVISHTGASTIPPKTIEALILHYVDSLLALIEFGLQENYVED
ncbi:MAG: HD domain-containing protein [Candidatus Aenigmatarchaeota archaeon]